MVEVKRTVKLVTEQRIITSKPPVSDGYPIRAWNISIYMLDEHGQEKPASVFEKAVYKLHPTFPKPVHTFKTPPFQIQEEGWGEFDMEIVLTAVEKGGEYVIQHDLNFQKEVYESTHVLTFRNPKGAFLQALKDQGLGPIGHEESNGVAKTKKATKAEEEASKKRKRHAQAVDIDKLAEGLQKLGEEDILHVVQTVHDGKTPETYTKNDVEHGEFHVDLYTLPDSVIRTLWEFVCSKVDI
ncbi:MAG: hypothetical protein M1826_004959 [Phylliscum demangeonii]|nr:MAG: hypothetical protein M1826_004959 [Phylliscum demangeonii]